MLTNYFLPRQKLVSKVRDGAKITKRYDLATTPHRRAEAHPQVSAQDKTIMNVLNAENRHRPRQPVRRHPPPKLDTPHAKSERSFVRTLVASPCHRRQEHWGGRPSVPRGNCPPCGAARVRRRGGQLRH